MKAEIVCIIDRSGSMITIIDDAIGGFNAFLEEQKKIGGEATLTFVQFDNSYEVVHENKPLDEVPALDRDTYVPRHTTALLDAVGRTIDDVGKRLHNTPIENRPDKVIVAILTDGMENASNKYKRSQIFDMITHQREKYQWEFIFLAANQDAFAEGSKLGIDVNTTFTFAATGAGTRSAYNDLSKTVASARTNNKTTCKCSYDKKDCSCGGGTK